MRASPSSAATDGMIAALLIGCAVFAAMLAYSGPMVGDELVHFAQVQRYLAGDFSVDTDHLTTIPGFHLLVAAIMRVTGADSLGAARLVNAGIGVLAVFAFHGLRVRTGNAADWLSSMQFAALPILFPFFFLVYTDVLSLALVLGAVAATLARRHPVSAALLVLAMLVRQNNVIWLGLLMPLALLQPKPARHVPELRDWMRDGWPYLFCALLFCLFWVWNGSISLSGAQANAHPDLRLGIGNIVFTLFLAGLLLPIHVAHGLAAFARKARANASWIFVPLVLFCLHVWAFKVDHPYNLIDPQWSWRNQILQATQSYMALHALVGVIATAAACGLASLPLRPAHAAWIYPASLAFLACSWLIETRYALIPLSLWLAFRCPIDRRAEQVTLLLWLIAAVGLFHGVMHGKPFL